MRGLSIAVMSLVLVGLQATPVSDNANDIDLKTPPNEWGTYYNLENEYPIKKETFNQAYNDYQSDPTKKTACKPKDADFERWFVSSKDDTIFIMSYYCRTKSARGYEHLKVQATGGSVKVLDFQDSLKGFGIMDARGYNNTKEGTAARQIRQKMLEKVRDQIREQKNPFDTNRDLCQNAGVQTLDQVETKTQNGLYYYKFPISCNYTGSGYDHMTYIEVVEDKDFKVLNGGNPTLIAMDIPEKNIQFVRELQESAKKASATTLVPLASKIL